MSKPSTARPEPAEPGRVVDHPGWQPDIVAMVCRWCTYAGADLAGTSRLTYPATVRLVRFPCTGRMNPLFILKAFEHGADGVLVSGCHPGDCHYVQGNLVARRRFTIFRSLMDFIGVDYLIQANSRCTANPFNSVTPWHRTDGLNVFANTVNHFIDRNVSDYFAFFLYPHIHQ